MGFLANTSGPLLLVLMKLVLLIKELTDVEYRSTHVLLGVLTPVDNVVLSMQTVTPCVMDRVVVPILHVVYSTHNHGSMYNCLPLQLLRLKFGFVEIYNEDSPIQLTELYVK